MVSGRVCWLAGVIVLASAAMDWKAVAKIAHGLSYADVVRACDDAAKDAVLHDQTEVSTRALSGALKRRRTPRK